MGALILDASVLIGLLDRADVHHQRAVDDVEAAARHERLRLPDAIVLACARNLSGELLTYDDRLRRTARDA